MNFFPEADAAFLANVTSDDSKFHMPRGVEFTYTILDFQAVLTDPQFFVSSEKVVFSPGGNSWFIGFKMADGDDKPRIQICLSARERALVVHHMVKIPNHKFSEFSYIESGEGLRIDLHHHDSSSSEVTNPIPVKDLIDCGFLNDKGALVVHFKFEVKAEIGYEQYRLFNFHDPIFHQDHQFTFKFEKLKLHQKPLYVDDRILIRTSEFFRKLILEDDQHELQVTEMPTCDSYYTYTAFCAFLQYLHGCRTFNFNKMPYWESYWGFFDIVKKYGMHEFVRYWGEEIQRKNMYFCCSFEFCEWVLLQIVCSDNLSKYLKVELKNKSMKEIRKMLSCVGIYRMTGEVMKTFVRRILEIMNEEKYRTNELCSGP